MTWNPRDCRTSEFYLKIHLHSKKGDDNVYEIELESNSLL